MTPPLLSPAATFLVEYCDLAAATGEAEARWEIFQLQHLNNPSLLGLTLKARQVGWSWLAAAEAVADSCLTPRTSNIFVSISQDEAAEKIRYAKQILEALDAEVRPGLLIDNRLELELVNGSRLISHPCRPIRGKGKANVYLDEFAHYPKDREIYTSALPVMTRGGRVRIGSSALGASGLFWEICSESLRKYPGYRRSRVHWWEVAGLCRDVAQARTLAPTLTTEERVRRWGTPRLIEIFENLPLEDFQQEYECAFVDETTAWITWDEIKRNQLEAQAGSLLYWRARSVDEAFRIIDEAAQAVREHRLETALVGGMDIGRKRHLSEIVLIGKGLTRQLPYRLGISLANVEFEDQRAVADRLLDALPVIKFLIDQNGLGMQLAEQLHQAHGDRAEGMDFTNANKELWSVEIKVRLQRGEVPLPLERSLSYQLHSIKKKVTAAKNAVFDTAANEKHHADEYWALALAVWAARAARPIGSFLTSYLQ